ncbi:hypothetical protein HG536_0A02700 [Torulaspora globosa]|uniref:Non-structural maintenance of chromosomes element 4 n=1 Tax=Torulaspora globosa TaxID=48254 RepID=A0A7G3ZAB7_9SACH|nr:uncharacterized protein HG536_0A02700 [Torulaspora globosa]QLL30453.1 hypothetical protein HG536_0A02700 [Torulaspora globosa]
MSSRRAGRVRGPEDETDVEGPTVRRRRVDDGTPESSESSARQQILQGYRALEGEMAKEKAKAARTGDIHIALKNLDAAESLFSKASGSRNLELFAHDAKAMVNISELAQMSVRNLKFDDSRSLVNLDDVLNSCKKYMLKEYFLLNDISEPVTSLMNNAEEEESELPLHDGAMEDQQETVAGTSSSRLRANTLRRSYLQQFSTYDQFHQFNWFRMGSLFDTLSRGAATVDHLSGPFSLEKRPRVTMNPRTRQIDSGASLTTAQRDLPASRGTEELTTPMLVKRCYEILRRKKGYEPINLFKLIINPSSYAKSVENLFYISFLLKEGKLILEEDEEGFPSIRIKEELPREAAAAELEAQRRRDAHQNHIIFQLDGASWKKLIDKFSISSSFLD